MQTTTSLQDKFNKFLYLECKQIRTEKFPKAPIMLTNVASLGSKSIIKYNATVMPSLDNPAFTYEDMKPVLETKFLMRNIYKKI